MRWLLPLVLMLASCAPSARFRPHSAAADFPGITPQAVEFYSGDVEYLDRAGAVLVGTVDAAGSSEDRRAERARCIAARNGGTHVIARNRWSAVTGSSTRIEQFGSVAFAQSQATTVEGETWLVVRVDRARWGELPRALRPEGVEAFPAPIWDGDPRLWDCR